MTRSFKLEDAMPSLTEIERGSKHLPPEPLPPQKRKETYYCDHCRKYHYIYSNIGNDHRDYRVSPQID